MRKDNYCGTENHKLVILNVIGIDVLHCACKTCGIENKSLYTHYNENRADSEPEYLPFNPYHN